MGKTGQSVFKGINSQTWASMSLFLQYFKDSNFSHIQLETPNFNDFNIVFEDGHKIICESKDWKRNFSYSHLKDVIDPMIQKANIKPKDEILIICSKVDRIMAENVENIKYYGEILENHFKDKSFSDKQIDVLRYIKFWEVPPSFNENIIYSLFSELIDFWLPESEIRKIVNDFLLEDFYKGSQKGRILKKIDFIDKIEKLKLDTMQRSGFFDDQRVKLESQIESIITALENNKSPVWANVPLSAISTKFELISLILNRINDKKQVILPDWEPIWQLYNDYRFAFSIFDIFKNNIDTPVNREYILQFIIKHIRDLCKFYYTDFVITDIVELISRVLSEDVKLINDIFIILKTIITDKQKDLFYIKTDDNEFWKKEKISELLSKIYINANDHIKKEVIDLIIKNFNLVEDDGKFSYFTPIKIFEILKFWLLCNPLQNLLELTDILSDQYDQYYKKFNSAVQFKGWELSGGVTTFWGSDYSVPDRHFISYCIKPFFIEYYNKNKIKCWRLIKSECIKPKNKITKEKPDFLNRAVIPVVLKRYSSNSYTISLEAHNILKEFLISKKGIPLKAEIIYQEINKLENLSDEKKWKLVKISLKEFKLPVSPIIENLVVNFIKQRRKEAIEAFERWMNIPNYYNQFCVEDSIILYIRAILSFNVQKAIEIFYKFIEDEKFNSFFDKFEAYDFASLLHDILIKDVSKGIEVLNRILKKEKLSKNLQILVANALFSREKNQKDDKNYLNKIYYEFLSPFFKSLDSDIQNIYSLFYHGNAREAFVQFAEKLADVKKVKEALQIIEIFINDPDPFLPGSDPEDLGAKFSEHFAMEKGSEPHSITSVRGWCGWILMKCAVIEGRDYLDKIMELTDKLIKDENYYVKHMGCFALSRLAEIRLNVLPKNLNILFFGNDVESALKRAKKVEAMAFELLYEISCLNNKSIQTAMTTSLLTVFDKIRALNEEDSLRLISAIKEFPDESIGKAAGLFIFFALFRKNAYKSQYFQLNGIYDDLGPDNYDERIFTTILLDTINNIQPEHKFHFAVQFVSLIKREDIKTVIGNKNYSTAYKYLNHLIEKYENKIYNIIFHLIDDQMEKDIKFFNWYNLLKKCLLIESEYLNRSLMNENINEFKWNTYFNISKLLLLTYKKYGKNRFLDLAEILFSYPIKVRTMENQEVVLKLCEFPHSNKKVQKILTYLVRKNPSQYYQIHKNWINKADH